MLSLLVEMDSVATSPSSPRTQQSQTLADVAAEVWPDHEFVAGPELILVLRRVGDLYYYAAVALPRVPPPPRGPRSFWGLWLEENLIKPIQKLAGE
jgi:hypothetical protein